MSKVKLTTNHGDITIELDEKKAPETARNFREYVSSGFFNNTVFHRVIDGFMIQGGGMNADLKEKPTRAPIGLESRTGLTNQRGTVAMARTNDPNSATAQFFINVSDNAFLDHTAPTPQGWGYAVFGKVVDGKDVVDKIRKVRTGSRGMHQDVPNDDVIIERAEEV